MSRNADAWPLRWVTTLNAHVWRWCARTAIEPDGRPRHLLTLLVVLLGSVPLLCEARPLSPLSLARLAAGQPVRVIVELDSAATDTAAAAERARRRLVGDDAAILALRAQGYAATRARLAAAATGPDAVSVHDYRHFPIAAWRLSSLAALNRLLGDPRVRAVHEDEILHPVSVDDLPFISQPQAAAQGASGAGTTIAVIDGGLGLNYQHYPDFGTCSAVNTPPSTCRVVFNWDFYSGSQASSETAHGTNVSAIALGVAPGANLAMLDVFQGSLASSIDINTALDNIVENRATYNIVAVNMSLGDGSSNSAQCGAIGQSPFSASISATLQAGIAVVAAAGNSGSKMGLGDPACVPGVISVGAVYDASYGTLGWAAAADSGGQCVDVSAADHVTCFSQSASYLSMLAPGSFVSAPDATFQESGTSQATPHITGAVAVLRARYPAESLSETLSRLQVSGVTDTDAGAGGRSTPRLNVLGAFDQGAAVGVSGSGPSTATAGQTATYTIRVTNTGPIDATTVTLSDALPAGATFKSASSGCTFSSPRVTCSLGTLASNASITITITVIWNISGPVYDVASVAADQANVSPQQTLAFGTAPTANDAPLPLWSYALLAIALIVFSRRTLVAAPRFPASKPSRTRAARVRSARR